MGLAGILYKDQTLIGQELSLMLASLDHRLKGGQTSHSYQNCVVGGSMDGVAILKQQGLTVGIDGSFANKEELKEKLKASGFSRLGADDASLCLNAYRIWGPDFVKNVDGHFAIFVLDEAERTLYLYRDRTGKKPLYWARTGQGLIFGSELKSLLASGWIPPQPDLNAIATQLALGYSPQDITPIEGVNKLLPAHFLRLSLDGGLALHPYWSLSEVFLTESHNPIDALQDIDNLMDRAVRARLDGRERAGCVLSGGIGTAAVAYFACRSKKSITAYSTCYSKQNEEDSQTAQEVANALNAPLLKESLSAADLLADLPRMMWHLEEPLSNVYTSSLWHLAKMASENGESLLFSGMGCDELLCAHTRYQLEARPPPLSKRLSGAPHWMLENITLPLLLKIAPSYAFEVLRQRHSDPIKRLYLDHSSLFSEKEMRQMAPQLANLWNPDVFLQKIYQHTPVTSGLSSLLYFDMKTQLVDAYCHQFDRLTSAFGLDWQAPFLDEPLIRYLIGLPAEQKCTEQETAIPLRALLARELPKEVVYRAKVTRPQFLSNWVDRKKLRHAFELLKKGSLVETGLISRKWLKQAIQIGARSPNGFQKLWSILMLEVWMQIFVNNPVSLTPPNCKLHELLERK